MYKKFKFFILTCWVFFTPLLTNAFADEQPITTDIAVLIDVSGSMKHTDPQNLRIPALTLFINLLPVNTQAGVWLFAEDTRVLIASGLVTEQWKKQALKKVAEIHSRGQFTNIEQALQTAIKDWSSDTLTQARNIILLTDGVVDITKDSDKNAASRQRILDELLPNIQQTGAHIQTIALSRQADSELLGTLAFKTKGWSEVVESASQLERIFLKMFKQAIPQDSVPLVDNKFTIDNSIKEFSALVFRKPGTSTTLLSGDKQKITKDKHSDAVGWINEKNYDLLTVKNPVAGEWQILGDIDPDNQVMILTDLRMEIKDVPAYKSISEPLHFDVHFTDKNELITRSDFLSLLSITLQQIDSTGKIIEHALKPIDSEKGFFQVEIPTPSAKERFTFKLLADGKTFTRELTHNITFITKPIEITADVGEAKRQVTLTFTPDAAIINPETLELEATVHQEKQLAMTLPIAKQEEGWRITLDAAESGEQKIVNFKATAKTRDDDSIQPDLEPFIINDALFKTVKPESSPEPEVLITQPLKPEETDKSPAVEENPVDWLTIALITGAINLALFAIGFIGYRLHKKSAAKKQAQLMERLA